MWVSDSPRKSVCGSVNTCRLVGSCTTPELGGSSFVHVLVTHLGSSTCENVGIHLRLRPAVAVHTRGEHTRRTCGRPIWTTTDHLVRGVQDAMRSCATCRWKRRQPADIATDGISSLSPREIEGV